MKQSKDVDDWRISFYSAIDILTQAREAKNSVGQI
jgi:hypothetical protein